MYVLFNVFYTILGPFIFVQGHSLLFRASYFLLGNFISCQAAMALRAPMALRASIGHSKALEALRRPLRLLYADC
jgi:hypothetical protein